MRESIAPYFLNCVNCEASGVGIILHPQFIGANSVNLQLQHNAWFDRPESVRMLPNLLGQLEMGVGDWPTVSLAY
jgi:hypothetical protein